MSQLSTSSRLYRTAEPIFTNFDNPHVGPFDLFEGDQVYFSQEFDDPGLVAVHSRIIAVAVAG